MNVSQMDIKLSRHENAKELEIPKEGWINAIRKALGMSKRQLAQRAVITTQEVTEIEAAEAAGTITLTALEVAARGLGCKVVYLLVPEAGSFQKLRADQAMKNANRNMDLRSSVSSARQISRKYEKDLLTKWRNEFWDFTN